MTNNDDKEVATFDDYTKCLRNRKTTVSCSTPLQANVGFGSHGGCGVGMFDCPGYDEGVVNDGWLYDLGDLNQSVPFVRKELLRWAAHMVKTYKIDAIRLDTAPYVRKDFLAELQETVNVEILGEVTTSNLTYHASFQQAKNGGKTENILAGTINFPLFYTTRPNFCGPYLDLNGVGYVMKAQLKDGQYARPDLLGNFVDNHDLPPRIGYSCKGEKTRVMNALAFTMFSRGVPIIYAGTEQGMAEKDDFRNALWGSGYRRDHELYNFMADMNRVRRAYNVSSVDAEVVVSSKTHLVFTRRGK
jgi:alpha-amylase